MIVDPRCDLTELLASACDHCKSKSARRSRPAPERVEVSGVPFEASYTGRCAACGGAIERGDLIGASVDGEGYVHADPSQCGVS